MMKSTHCLAFHDLSREEMQLSYLGIKVSTQDVLKLFLYFKECLWKR